MTPCWFPTPWCCPSDQTPREGRPAVGGQRRAFLFFGEGRVVLATCGRRKGCPSDAHAIGIFTAGSKRIQTSSLEARGIITKFFCSSRMRCREACCYEACHLPLANSLPARSPPKLRCGFRIASSPELAFRNYGREMAFDQWKVALSLRRHAVDIFLALTACRCRRNHTRAPCLPVDRLRQQLLVRPFPSRFPNLRGIHARSRDQMP